MVGVLTGGRVGGWVYGGCVDRWRSVCVCVCVCVCVNGGCVDRWKSGWVGVWWVR